MKYVDYDIMFQEVPDEVSLVVNISNCPNRCKGCHSSYLMNDIGNILDTEAMESIIGQYENLITCICFMGGDAAPHEIEDMAKWINLHYGKKYSIAWYSGKEEIPGDVDINLFRYIKTGRYMEELGNLRSKKTNQRFFEVDKKLGLIDRTYLFWK